jgi:SAM-dependent methyltransferase
LGLDIRQFFEKALLSSSARLLNKRLQETSHRELLGTEDIAEHYGDIRISDRGLQNVILSFVAARLSFIEHHLGPREIRGSTFADIGDSSGIFLRGLDKPGIGMNFLTGAARNLGTQGVQAIRGDAMQLPFLNDSFDYLLCFETLEHLENPVGALQELYRVCRKGVFISVPYVSRTTVYPPNYREGVQELLHVFELSSTHWKALLAHTNFLLERTEVIRVLDKSRGLRERVAFGVWRTLYGKDVYCGTFQAFLVCYLRKLHEKADNGS